MLPDVFEQVLHEGHRISRGERLHIAAWTLRLHKSLNAQSRCLSSNVWATNKRSCERLGYLQKLVKYFEVGSVGLFCCWFLQVLPGFDYLLVPEQHSNGHSGKFMGLWTSAKQAK